MTKLEILLNIKPCLSEESYMGERICVFLSKDFQFIVSYNSLSNYLLMACSYYCDWEEPTWDHKKDPEVNLIQLK